MLRLSPWLLVCCLFGAFWWARSSQHCPPPLPPPPATRLAFNPAEIQATVEFWAARSRRDPQGAIERAFLASAYLRRCRETGDIADAIRAEQAAHQSLKIRTNHNAAATNALAASLLTQHRFSESRAIARSLIEHDGDLQARYLASEASMELGDYALAETLISPAATRDAGPESPNGLALRARLLDLKGQPATALDLYRRAQAIADANLDMPAPSVAWFHMRVGQSLASMGRAAETESSYQEAIHLFPQDHLALTLLARLAAAEHHWQAAIGFAKQSAAIVPTPDALAVLGDAYFALGRRAEAEEQFSLIDTIARLSRVQGSIYDRQRALFNADHNRHLPEALDLARREIQMRQDIYAHDTYAWALFKNGSLAEAAREIRKAMALGTRDALLFYHAGAIALARGDRSEAKRLLSLTLSTNPYFHPTAVDTTRALLASLHQAQS